VELAFTPHALVPDDAEQRFRYEPSPTQWSPYEAGLWSFPPKDYGKWAGLVRALVEHCVARYGATHVRGWLWELWNEPDISLAVLGERRRHLLPDDALGDLGHGGSVHRRHCITPFAASLLWSFGRLSRPKQTGLGARAHGAARSRRGRSWPWGDAGRARRPMDGSP
jgi:hypothetical protein